MTASPGREVDRNLLPGAGLGSTRARTEAQDAGSQDLGDLVEALGGGHQVGVEGMRHPAVDFVLVILTYPQRCQSVGRSRTEARGWSSVPCSLGRIFRIACICFGVTDVAPSA